MPSYIDIDCWIERHALPNISPTHAPTRKRALADMNPNSQQTPPRKSSKKTDNVPNTHDDGYNDLDDTPRGVQKLDLTDNAPVFPPPTAPASASASASAPVSSHSPPRSRSPPKRGRDTDDDSQSNRPSRTSKHSTRASSPRKRLAARQTAPGYPTKQALLSDWARLSADVKSLARYFKQLKEKKAAILPARCDTDEFRAALSQGDNVEDEELFGHIFTSEDTGIVPDLEWARHIVDMSRSNVSRAVCEAHWNSSVHHSVLSAALKPVPNLLADNITSATITTPADVSCKVDFAISLNLPQTTLARLIAADVQALNHTDYFPLWHSPIAVSIETKVDNGEEPKAKVQLSTWATAQMMALRVLLRKAGSTSTVIPPIPLVFVAGDLWVFWCWRDEGEYGGASFYSDGFQFGTTATLLGCYEVVAGLRRLATWAEKEWRGWWERDILGPLGLMGGESEGEGREVEGDV